jgi:hypothetical protein
VFTRKSGNEERIRDCVDIKSTFLLSIDVSVAVVGVCSVEGSVVIVKSFVVSIVAVGGSISDFVN